MCVLRLFHTAMSVRSSSTTAGVCGPAEHSRRKQQQQPERSMARLLHLGALETLLQKSGGMQRNASQTNVYPDGSSGEPDADVDIVITLGHHENSNVELRNDSRNRAVLEYLLLALSIRLNDKEKDNGFFEWQAEYATDGNDYDNLLERLNHKLEISSEDWTEDDWKGLFGIGNEQRYNLMTWNSEAPHEHCRDKNLTVLEFSCKSAMLESFLDEKIAPGSSTTNIERLRGVAYDGGW